MDTVVEEVNGREAIAVLAESIPAGLRQKALASLEFSSSSTDYYSAFVVRRSGSIAAIAPNHLRTTDLPIRFGEKIVWRGRIDSALVPSSAQGTFSEVDDAVALLAWARSTHPKLALFFPDLFTEEPLCTAVLQGKDLGYRILGATPAKHLFHKFEDSYDAFFGAKRSKYKNQLRKKEKIFLERVGSDFRLEEYRSTEQLDSFLAAADCINKKTYQYNLFGESVGNTQEDRERYLKLAQHGEFRSFVLWHAEKPLCFILGFQRMDGIFRHVMTGFDPEWRECAPGINCNILMLRRLYQDDRPKLLDFGSGDADYKRLFANETRYSCSPLLIPNSLAYSFIYSLHVVSARTNDIAVGLLNRWGLKDRIKRLLRRRASR
jgi:hypothetical protein